MSHEYVVIAEGIRIQLKGLVAEVRLLRQAVERAVDADPLTLVAEAMKDLDPLGAITLGPHRIDDLQTDPSGVESGSADDPLADVPPSERYRFAPVE